MILTFDTTIDEETYITTHIVSRTDFKDGRVTVVGKIVHDVFTPLPTLSPTFPQQPILLLDEIEQIANYIKGLEEINLEFLE